MRIVMRLVCLLPALALVSVIPAGAADVNGTLAVDPTRIAGADER